ncbi:hypothetical protein IWQ57_004636 [Coemansia nantahalensis]|uniref:Uncharacterized protein n=1 Tax=Coemansia nantahalensis TaxID=2789366 RepID=A0ACC1JR33_9FUNG|nr:hypothetical protein IWQ57_004636 [Coemansia nantahalensis]
MDDRQQTLRVHDYTLLATLGLSALYASIAARLEGEQGLAASDRAAWHTLGGPPQARAAVSPARKRKSAFSADAAASSTPASSRLQSPQSSRTFAETPRSRSRAAPRAGWRVAGGGAAHGGRGTRLKSAFARVEPNGAYGAEGDTGAEAGAAEGRLRRGRAHATRADVAAAGAGAVDARPKEHGEVWFDRYLILARLGEGAFSRVFLAADLFCSKMGRRHDGARLVTIKRMGAREGAIGMAEYQTLSLLNRLDPKDRTHIVRIHGMFLHVPRTRSAVDYDATPQHLVFAQQPRRPSRAAADRQSGGRQGRRARQLADRERLRVFGGAPDDADLGALAGSDALQSSMSVTSAADDSCVCLVMEPLLGRTLHDAFPRRISALYGAQDEIVAKQMHMDMIRTVVRQLLVALAHMHGHALIHADIKTTNVICVNDAELRVKLIDFGNAVSDSDVSEYYSTFEIQTVWFRAPEVAYQRPFGRAIDLWSIGCVMCELWLGRPLFTDMDNRSLIRSILKLRGPPPAQLYSASPIYAEVAQLWGGRPTPGFAPAAAGSRHKGLLHPELSMDWEPQLRMQWLKHSLHVPDDDFVSLADALLEYDPEERPSAAEALEHPFFQGMYAH